MQLQDIIPKRVAFGLRATEKEYFLRPFNLNDEVWIKSKYSEEEFSKILHSMDMPEIVKIVYHQLENEYKAEFKATEVIEYDDDGNEITRKISGPEKLSSAIQGFDEQLLIYKALMECRGLSMPVLEEINKELAKKKLGQ
ncbi:MAG: hypothetical protein HQK52_19460 [Oligoflexia bacterium]|nr:hypothetical protein [Oligoflexia bacterium]